MSFINPKWQDAVKFGRSTYGIRKIIRLYIENDSSITIPRGGLAMIEDIISPEEITSFEETLTIFPPVKITSKIELRPLQIPWVENMLKNHIGIGIAPAGSGKTVMALEILSRLGQPTLWLTHRLHLVDQVIQRAESFLGDIGEIGIIGGGKKKPGDILTIGMLATLSKSDISDMSNKFGLVILDEAHICPMNTAVQVVEQLAPSYLYGVTATPYREDRLEPVMYSLLGPEIARMNREDAVELRGIMPAKVKVVRTGIKYPVTMQYEFSKIMDYLMEHPKRNELILVKLLSELALDNICVVLTSRRAHGKILKDVLNGLNIPCEHVYTGSLDGKSVSKKERAAAIGRFISGETKVIIATYQLLSEGFDHAPLNRVFFVLPQKAKGRLEQSKGRVERFLVDKGDAIVYDFVDDITMLKNQFEVRMNHYQEHNLQVSFE